MSNCIEYPVEKEKAVDLLKEESFLPNLFKHFGNNDLSNFENKKYAIKTCREIYRNNMQNTSITTGEFKINLINSMIKILENDKKYKDKLTPELLTPSSKY